MSADPASERYGVVIIGAGVAGIATANQLVQDNFTDFVLLEARDRIGGRICTIDYEGQPLELGAQWVHGDEGNPVHAIAASHGLLVDELDTDNNDDDVLGASFHIRGGRKVEHKTLAEVSQVVNSIRTQAIALSLGNGTGEHAIGAIGRGILPNGCIGDGDDSMGEFWRRKYDKYLNPDDCHEDGDEKTNQLKVALHDWYDRWEAVDNACSSLDELSLRSWGLYVVRGCDFELKRGYRSLLNLLLVPAVLERTCLSAAVSEVDWSAYAPGEGMHHSGHLCGSSQLSGIQQNGRPPASKETDCRGDGILVRLANGRTIMADHVVVTASVGFLQHEPAFFAPALPLTKQNAISRLQFGTTNKIYLMFDEPFWADPSYRIDFLWLDGDTEGIQRRLQETGIMEEPFTGTKELMSPWWQSILQFHAVPKQPRVLEGWIAGAGAEAMELLDEALVLLTCWVLLAEFTGQPTIAKPKVVMRTKWHQTEYIYGSYTSIPPGVTAKEIRAYAQPVYAGTTPRLLFAGEGTQVADYSTVHGAYSSGVSAATLLCNYFTSR